MIRYKSLLFIVGLLWNWTSTAQIADKQTSITDSVVQDSVEIKNQIYYPAQLKRFFTKLEKLEKTKQGKVNIVHIGDSHIQADFFSGKMRDLLQSKYGNGGWGLTFPYKLAKTNGTAVVRYSSNVDWENRRNIFPVASANVGLSGIALSTSQKNFVIEMNVRNKEEYGFSKMRVFTPSSKSQYEVGTTAKKIEYEEVSKNKVSHKVKQGETLSGIARKYGTTVKNIQSLSNLKGTNIGIGKTLVVKETVERKIITKGSGDFTPLKATKFDGYTEYKFASPQDKLYFYPDQDSDLYELNGIYVENDKPGVVYSTIGVNGARYSDFNKYDLFFEQLKGLQPDLIIVSMGTNESFDRMSGSDFGAQVKLFMNKVKAQYPNVDFLLTTPPPSYFSKGTPNLVATELTNELIISGIKGKYAIWDLYYSLGGSLGLPKLQEEGMLSKDLVHYTVKGYDYSGALFFDALVEAYLEFKQKETK